MSNRDKGGLGLDESVKRSLMGGASRRAVSLHDEHALGGEGPSQPPRNDLDFDDVVLGRRCVGAQLATKYVHGDNHTRRREQTSRSLAVVSALGIEHMTENDCTTGDS